MNRKTHSLLGNGFRQEGEKVAEKPSELCGSGFWASSGAGRVRVFRTPELKVIPQFPL